MHGVHEMFLLCIYISSSVFAAPVCLFMHAGTLSTLYPYTDNLRQPLYAHDCDGQSEEKDI